MQQTTLKTFTKKKSKNTQESNSSTFVNNMSLPIHRWYRYSAGFSAKWVEKTIKKYSKKKKLTILDPFAGSGTVLLAGEKTGNLSYGVESHPFVSKITEAKLHWRTDINKFLDFSKEVLSEAKLKEGNSENYNELIKRCYSKEILDKLDTLKHSLYERRTDAPEYKLTWLALISILRKTSHAGTANWQYVLPNKTKKMVLDPYVAFEMQISMMAKDMKEMRRYIKNSPSVILNEDARNITNVPANSIDFVITSPPYINNYDYADATRLELSFLGDINGWGELHDKIRQFLICSCSQHVTNLDYDWEIILKDELLVPIADELTKVYKQLESVRLSHGGKKNYHKMVLAYFYDLAKVWIELRKVCKPNSNLCFVIGDSAPYGIHIPVENWLGRLALNAGFKEYRFIKTRDRNIKWDNRIHKIPLQEGRLWLRG